MTCRLITASAFAGFLASAALAQPVAPCLTAGPTCTEWVVLGGGPQRSLIYRSFALDKRNDAITRVLVSIHGAGRDADNYFRSTLAAGFLADALENTLIVVPRMASSDGAGCRDILAPNEISWNCNSWRSGGPAVNSPAVTSFDFLDEILRKVARRDLFPNVKAIVVAGHSAGGQVVNRYEMTNQVHDHLGVPVTYVVSNPSSYAYPDATRPVADAGKCATYNRWPYGLEERGNGYTSKIPNEQLKKQLAARPTVYLLGEIDILPLGGFDGSCSAMAQGPTRLARGQSFVKLVTTKYGAKDSRE